MKIKDILNLGKPTISFEVFPPKTLDSFDKIEEAALKIASNHPDFMSVTYRIVAGDSAQNTLDIAASIQNKSGVPALAHLTCVSTAKDQLHSNLEKAKAMGIENILALRGDIPDGYVLPENGYRYASDLVTDIKKNGDFCIGAACYPEGHPEAPDKETDMRHLKMKVDAGVDFLTTQMFFDNSIFYSFLYRIREIGITCPVLAGIMPITSKVQVENAMRLSGSIIPARFASIVDKFSGNPVAMKQAGIAYATDQIIDLVANGVKGIHVYSMNKPDVATKLRENLSEIL